LSITTHYLKGFSAVLSWRGRSLICRFRGGDRVDWDSDKSSASGLAESVSQWTAGPDRVYNKPGICSLLDESIDRYRPRNRRT